MSSPRWPFHVLSRLHLIWCASGDLAHLCIPTDHHIVFTLGYPSYQQVFLIRAESRVQLSGASHMEGVKDISSYLVHKLTQNVTQAVQQTQYDSTDISAVTDDLSHFKPTKSKKQNQMCDARDDKKKRKEKIFFIHIVMLPLFTASLMINPCRPQWNIPITTGCIHI